MLKSSSSLDHQLMLLIGTIGAGTLLTWLATRSFNGPSLSLPSTPSSKLSNNDQVKEDSEKTDPRNFVKLMNDQNRNEVIIFYGSQTGTGEEYALRLGKECKKRFNIQPMVADIENYDLAYLDTLSKDSIAIFVISTYGEGDPTDSAVHFWDLLHRDVPTFSKDIAVDQPLADLRYFMFGLGNRTYEHFNAASIVMDNKLTKLGATRLGELGAGDDDGSLEDDFMTWQEQFWPLLTDAMVKQQESDDIEQQQQQQQQHHRAYTVMEKEDDGSFYYMGELGDTQLTWGAKRPYPAHMNLYDLTPKSRDLRHCLHLEVDIADSGMSYTTGDHLGIWPTNNELEINLVASLFGWDDARLDKVISVLPTDPTNRPPFPQPTTLRAALRHYLDIAQLPSRSTLETLVPYISDNNLKSFLQQLIDDKAEYKKVVLDQVRNLGQLLIFALLSIGHVSTTTTSQNGLQNIPLDVILECYSRLQPRYYSISSSSSESGTKVSATAVTLQYNPPSSDRTVYGVNTNYLWAIHQKQTAASSSITSTESPKYMVEGPRQQYMLTNNSSSSSFKIPVHLRKSNFRLPPSSSTPVIMVGPGTGVAPFRGFIRERVHQKQVLDQQVGTTVLFFGCRRSTEDYLYADEWPELFNSLGGGASRIITAFSREQEGADKKVYVQHRLAEHGQEMWDLLANQGAHFYVCGDAKYMAKDVQQAVMDMATTFGGLDTDAATAFIQTLRKSNRYVEDIWA